MSLIHEVFFSSKPLIKSFLDSMFKLEALHSSHAKDTKPSANTKLTLGFLESLIASYVLQTDSIPRFAKPF